MKTSSFPARDKRLILFDLDGVLLDSRSNMETAWHRVRGELGLSVPFESYFAEIGRPFGDIMRILGLQDEAETIEAVFRKASKEALVDTPFFPGIEAILLELKRAGRKLGIVTSKDAERTRLVVERLPVAMDFVHTPGGVCRGKPAPDPLLLAMATANADPAETVYVGDMDPDAECAARAGVDYIHAAWGYGGVPRNCLAQCAGVTDLARHLLSDSAEDLCL